MYTLVPLRKGTAAEKDLCLSRMRHLIEILDKLGSAKVGFPSELVLQRDLAVHRGQGLQA